MVVYRNIDVHRTGPTIYPDYDNLLRFERMVKNLVAKAIEVFEMGGSDAFSPGSLLSNQRAWRKRRNLSQGDFQMPTTQCAVLDEVDSTANEYSEENNCDSAEGPRISRSDSGLPHSRTHIDQSSSNDPVIVLSMAGAIFAIILLFLLGKFYPEMLQSSKNQISNR